MPTLDDLPITEDQLRAGIEVGNVLPSREQADRRDSTEDETKFFDVRGFGRNFGPETLKRLQSRIAKGQALRVRREKARLSKDRPPIAKLSPRSKDIIRSLEEQESRGQIPAGATDKVTAVLGTRELEETEIVMKTFGKSFIPGWLTVENWNQMTSWERGASIAGDIGQAILYIIPGVMGIKALYSNKPAGALKGQFPKKVEGLRILTKRETEQILKGMADKGFVKGGGLKKTVPLETPVKAPIKITTIVEETPAGVRFITGPKVKPFIRRTDTALPPSMKPPPPKLPRRGKELFIKRPPERGVGAAEPVIRGRTTLEQFLKESGIKPSTTIRPVIIPIPTTEKAPITKPSPLPRIEPLPKPKPKPRPVPKPKPVPRPKPVPLPKPKPVPEPRKVPTPEPVPEPEPTPEPVVTPEPVPTPEPKPEPTPTPTPEPKPEPEPTPTPTPTPTPEPIVTIKPPPGAIPPRFNRAEDSKRRREIERAKGAIAWRQGELHGKDRWDVVTSPFTKEENYTIVLGRQPLGAFIAKGPGSAFKTARIIFGPRIKKNVLIDQPGIFSTELSPTGTKAIRLTFHKDIDISKKIGSLEEKGRVFPLP